MQVTLDFGNPLVVLILMGVAIGLVVVVGWFLLRVRRLKLDENRVRGLGASNRKQHWEQEDKERKLQRREDRLDELETSLGQWAQSLANQSATASEQQSEPVSGKLRLASTA